jgi:nucleotide-binding universal stress UspA family protein
MKSFERILVATDLTPASEPALAEAFELAKESRAELQIAYVHQPSNIAPAEAVAGGVFDEWVQNLRDRAREMLQALVEKARKEGVVAEGLFLSGNPDEAIALTAEAGRVDLVIIGTHGRKGLKKFFLGSVASRVIASAPCPVLTVRAAA